MKIIASVFGSRGDVEPLILLSAELRRRGHDAQVVAHPDLEDLAAELGVPYHSCGDSIRETMAKNAAETGDSLRSSQGMAAIRAEVASQFEGMSRVCDGADLVIAAGVNMAAVHVAEAVGASVRWLVMCPRVLPSAEHPPFFLTAESLPPAVNAFLWKSMQLGAKGFAGTVNAERAKLGLGKDRGGDPFFDASYPPVLACDRILGPLPPKLAEKAVQTAALLPPVAGTLPAEVEAFLAEGEPPVFVGFGSMGMKDAGVMTRLVVEAVRKAGVRAVVARGWGRLAAEPLPEGFLAVDELPFGSLFPRMAAVVHHGGAGTTATAARSGVPQVLTPQIADQFYWAARVRDLGVAPAGVPMKKMTADALASAIATAVGSAPMAVQAKELAHDLADVDGVALTADEILRSAEARVA